MTKLSMHQPLPFDEATSPSLVSTGELPKPRASEGRSSPRPMTLSARTARVSWRTTSQRWRTHRLGCSGSAWSEPGAGSSRSVTSRRTFSIQSVSKPFVFALVCEAIGYEAARHRLGVNSTGFPFNSLMAVELNDERTMNPLVNAGRSRPRALYPAPRGTRSGRGSSDTLSRFAGRELTLSRDVYDSESATNMRNQGIAHLLESYERLYFDPDEATDIYTRQCSLEVTVHDLAVMGATLANGGVNPMTGERVIVAGVCRRVLAVMQQPACTSCREIGCSRWVCRARAVSAAAL